MTNEIVDQNALRYAAELGYIDRVRSLVKEKIDINTKFHNGMSALNIALVNFHPEVAVVLIEAGADTNIADNMGFSPLHIACRRNYIHIVELLCSHGALIDNKDKKDHFTPLALACSDNKTAIAEFLIKHGSNVSCQDKYGVSPLHLAMVNQNTRLMKLLLAYTVDISFKSEWGLDMLGLLPAGRVDSSLVLERLYRAELRWRRRKNIVLLLHLFSKDLLRTTVSSQDSMLNGLPPLLPPSKAERTIMKMLAIDSLTRTIVCFL